MATKGLCFRNDPLWKPSILPLWYTEGLPPSLLRSSNSPTAQPCSGWDASWASRSCAQSSCASEVHAHPSTTQPDLPRLECPSTWTAQRVKSLSKTNYMNETNLFSVPYCFFSSSCFLYAVLYCVVIYTHTRFRRRLRKHPFSKLFSLFSCKQKM